MTRSTPNPTAAPPAPHGHRASGQDAVLTPWTATVLIELPGEGNYRMHDTVVERIRDYFKGYGPLVAEYENRLAVVLGVDARDVSGVYEIVTPIVTKITRMLGLPTSAAADLRVTRVASVPGRQTPEDPGALVGVVEAAAILQVSKQRVAQLSQRPDFPPPVDRLRATPVWRSEEIRAYAWSRRRVRARGTG